MELTVRPIPSHSNSLGNNAEKDTAGCRASDRKYIVIGDKGVPPGTYLKEADRRALRCGETLALLWTDLDVENMTISVTKQVNWINGELKISQPKIRNFIRTIPIPKQVMDLLILEHEKHPDRER